MSVFTLAENTNVILSKLISFKSEGFSDIKEEKK